MLERLQEALGERYRIERQIGAGGMAMVFLATDVKHRRAVAIKVLRPELAATLGPERFLREIEIAAKLQHPHILPVYDSGETNGLLYYVMPFVQGESLRDRLLREGPLPPESAARIASEVADALAYAHAEGIVHRDVKPANILLSQGHAVVADFGIARAVSASAREHGLTQAGMAVGTPVYMSPEQAMGEAAVDGRTDVYSLGVVLYEMTAGAPPFAGATPQAIIAQTLSRAVPRLRRDSGGLQPVIQRALAKEPRNRPTASELTTALSALASGTRPGTAWPRRSRGLLVAGGVVLAAVVGVAVWAAARPAGDPRKSLIVFPFANKTGDPARDYLREASMNLLGLAASHWQDMRVYDDERTASLMRRRGGGGTDEVDFEDARAMAREARVGTLVMGDLRREGDSLAVAAKVHDVRTGERIETLIVRAAWDADPRPLFDSLAASILGTSGAPPGERPSVIAQTTNSIAAYRAYLEGTRALQRFQVDSAKQLLQRAVTLDSSFALAYIRLRDADGWDGPRGDPERRRQYIVAAARYSESLPPRLRALVDYHRAYSDLDFQRARAVAEGMIRRDSTDVEAWYQLGEAHYHHRSLDYPHPDTLGNLGLALRAFRRTLELDSTYVLAYQHIVDALDNCSGGFRLCMADSVVYGSPAELERRFGRAAIDRLRVEAQTARIATARAWIAAVPSSPRPRLALLHALYHSRRYDETLREAEAMEGLGWAAEAAVPKAMVLFQLGHPAAAADAVHEGLRVTADTVAAFVTGIPNWSVPAGLLAGGGRWAAGLRLNATLFSKLPFDSVNGPGGIRMAAADLRRLTQWFLAAGLGQPRAAPRDFGNAAAELRAVIERYSGGDATRRQRVTQALGPAAVGIFLATRDTLPLSYLVRHADTLRSTTWRVADAHLALARGDTLRARLRVERHYRRPDEFEVTGEQGAIRSFAWGDLLARLGEPRLAITAYARLDSIPDAVDHPPYVVRSWAERGALHQRLGETAEAARQYQRFIEAWEGADPELRPFLERARAAVATLRGDARRTSGDAL